MNYPWPGNVRELKSVLERAFIFAKGQIIQLNDLPKELLNFSQQYRNSKKVSLPSNHLSKLTLIEHEKQLILEALKEANGNKRKAAQKLGISRATLYNKMRKYGLLRDLY
jgi:DNA-binding NtrC family response regulator